ncbi:hypothetical protein O181_000072 [Austropuccinia psidii MF-1]|uniref:Uncharacterized protein n=1 Tax=Austropuccinia psidii MF-1 TaxID=1389203 RepID=A0A9Q3B807_9BASI|nr:hypothetical protein [Austropuccinia psidii MF-1]
MLPARLISNLRRAIQKKSSFISFPSALSRSSERDVLKNADESAFSNDLQIKRMVIHEQPLISNHEASFIKEVGYSSRKARGLGQLPTGLGVYPHTPASSGRNGSPNSSLKMTSPSGYSTPTNKGHQGRYHGQKITHITADQARGYYAHPEAPAPLSDVSAHQFYRVQGNSRSDYSLPLATKGFDVKINRVKDDCFTQKDVPNRPLLNASRPAQGTGFRNCASCETLKQLPLKRRPILKNTAHLYQVRDRADFSSKEPNFLDYHKNYQCGLAMFESGDALEFLPCPSRQNDDSNIPFDCQEPSLSSLALVDLNTCDSPTLGYYPHIPTRVAPTPLKIQEVKKYRGVFHNNPPKHALSTPIYSMVDNKTPKQKQTPPDPVLKALEELKKFSTENLFKYVQDELRSLKSPVESGIDFLKLTDSPESNFHICFPENTVGVAC